MIVLIEALGVDRFSSVEKMESIPVAGPDSYMIFNPHPGKTVLGQERWWRVHRVIYDPQSQLSPKVKIELVEVVNPSALGLKW